MNIVHGGDLKLDWIRTPEQFEALKRFAATFNHKVKMTQWPIVALRFGDRPWHGYAQIYTGPVVFSAWHTDPNVCSPRDLVESFKAMQAWGKFQYGGGFVGVPTKETNFTQQIMEKLGFTRAFTELYEILG